METIRIIIADEEFLIREGLKSIFAGNKEIVFVAEIATKEELLREIKSKKPDIVILDHLHVSQFMVNDLAFIRKLSPATNILIISEINNKELVHIVIGHGVNGFLTKTCDRSEIHDAIYALKRNEKMYCHKVVDIILEHPAKNPANCDPAILSEREIEIIRLIAGGYTTKEIADSLYRSFHTISTHRKNIMKKLGINSTSELLIYAINTGLISSSDIAAMAR